MFLPMTKDEMRRLGWEELDVILVTGDAYIDSPLVGIAIIGKVLVRAGYRVGVISQPDLKSNDIAVLGEPKLFWGVTGGCVDSLVANTTALKKRRRDDDYTPGGINNRRPDRAVIAYSNLIRRHFKATRPIVLGGLEASPRRIAHYDYWSDSIRRSILFDAKADYLIYGMGERSVLELAEALRDQQPVSGIRGLCEITKIPPESAIILPAFEEVVNDRSTFTQMFRQFYDECDPIRGGIIAQQHSDRWLVQYPPAENLAQADLDAIYDLDFECEAHPLERAKGPIRALETIRFSLVTHRGCYGECNFCAIAVHQGRRVTSRSRKSVVREAKKLTSRADFKGYLHLGGSPTGNMYGFECVLKEKAGACPDKRCLVPEVCKILKVDHRPQVDLLDTLRGLPGVKHVFVTAGIRYDLLLADKHEGGVYLDRLVRHHISGQMKIAPEHSEDHVLAAMGKPVRERLDEFQSRFEEAAHRAEKRVFLSYYLIAAHPGCTHEDMIRLKAYTRQKLGLNPEQVQIFTPLPSTWSAVMYWTETDPFTGKPLFVEKDTARKRQQKEIVVAQPETGRGRNVERRHHH